MTTDADSCRPRGTDWVGNGSATSAPEAASGGTGGVGAAGFADTFQRVVQGTYSAPVTNQLLLEAGYSSYFSRWGWMEPPGAVLDLNQVTDTAHRPDLSRARLAFQSRQLEPELARRRLVRHRRPCA